jgi:hypothetical protein
MRYLKIYISIILITLPMILSGCNYIKIVDSENVTIEFKDEFTRDGNTDANLGLK